MLPEARIGERSVRGGLVTPSWEVPGKLLTGDIVAQSKIEFLEVRHVLEDRDVT